MKKRAVLAVSFGTSYNDSRIKNIEAIEEELKAEFTEYEFRRAFTSQVIINILKKRDGVEVDSVSRALERLADEGVEQVLIQPTHVMGGEENDCMLEAVESCRGKFKRIVCGKPLLTDEDDFSRLSDALLNDTREYDQQGTEIILMGHGTEHAANTAYKRLAKVFLQKGHEHYHVGTVEAEPTFESMMKEVAGTDSRRVILQPLMIVSGDHAHNDMAGEHENSWKSRLEAAGYQVTCRLKGMGEIKDIRRMFVDHAREAGKRLDGESLTDNGLCRKADRTGRDT